MEKDTLENAEREAAGLEREKHVDMWGKAPQAAGTAKAEDS